MIKLFNEIEVAYREECQAIAEDGYKVVPTVAEFFLQKLKENGLICECCCEKCVHFSPFETVEDFDGYCVARGCETDKTDSCNWAATRRACDKG